MATEVKISELPAVTTGATTDIIPVVQGGVTKQETITQVISDSVNANAQLASQNQVTGLATSDSPTFAGLKIASSNFDEASQITTAVSANATALWNFVTDNSSQRTITLLTADAAVAGRIKYVKDRAGTAGSANNILIATQGGETIDGQAASGFKISVNYGVFRFRATGTAWETF